MRSLCLVGVCRSCLRKLVLSVMSLSCFFLGITVFSIFIRCLGSCFAVSSRSVSDCFFASVILLLSFFLYCLCFCLFSGVGFSSLSLYSWCCFCICRLNLGVIQWFLRRFCFLSYVSIVLWIAICML